MKIMIEIPEEFICDYEADRFEDCFQRFIHHTAGNYEQETADMLIKAFRDAEEVKQGEWIKAYEGNYQCSECGDWVVADEKDIKTLCYCTNCGVKMVGER